MMRRFSKNADVKVGKIISTKERLAKLTAGAGGMTSAKLMTDKQREIAVNKSYVRKFDDDAERARNIHYSNIQIKDHAYFNKTDSLWNEPERLEPNKFARYSVKNCDLNNTFKQTVVDLEGLAAHDRQ